MHKVALITGASRGIGRAVALQLAADGLDIWLNYRANHAQAQEVKAQIEKQGVSCTLLPFDVSNAHP